MAVVIVLIAFCAVMSSTLSTWIAFGKDISYNQAKKENDYYRARWDHKFYNKELEETLDDIKKGYDNSIDVKEEIRKAFKGTKYWEKILWSSVYDENDPLYKFGVVDRNYSIDGKFGSWNDERRVGRDVVSANRGYIPKNYAHNPEYPAHLYLKPGEDHREAAYEYADTIRRLLYEQGAYRKLYLHPNGNNSCYVWEDVDPGDPKGPSPSRPRVQLFLATHAWVDTPPREVKDIDYKAKY